VVAEEREAVGLVRRCEHLQEEPAEQAREHAHGEKERRPTSDPALAVVGQTAARHDHVQVRMVRHRRAPAVEHGGDADPGAEMLGIGGDRKRGLGRRLEQQVVDDRLVLVGDIGDRRRQREHEVEVADRQQLGLARGKPLLCGGALTFGAMPVATANGRRPLPVLDKTARGSAAWQRRSHPIDLHF
jgi:hypothetical protein